MILSSESSLRYERFEAYGFGVDYPYDWTIELNPKSTRSQGDIAFKSSSGHKIFLSWGELRKVENLHGVDGHADFSIQKISRSSQATVRGVKRESANVNGHPSSSNKVELELTTKGSFFNRVVTLQEVHSLHVHCDISSRYFVMYGFTPREKSQEGGEVVAKMTRTFLCHR
jgi:hypothetical protein